MMNVSMYFWGGHHQYNIPRWRVCRSRIKAEVRINNKCVILKLFQKKL